MRLLLVEDDDGVAAVQCDVLRRHGFDVVRARSAAEALDAFDDSVDVVLLDLGLPDRDGLELCAQIRRSRDVPILITTARADLRSRVHGLNLGADDYLVKPYDVRELMARIHAVTRRAGSGRSDRSQRDEPVEPGQSVHVRGVAIDLGRREVCVADQPVPLTRKEFDVLALLARQPGIVFRREQILSEVWEGAAAHSGHTLDVHVASLRAKTGVPDLVETVRGVGYRLGVG